MTVQQDDQFVTVWSRDEHAMGGTLPAACGQTAPFRSPVGTAFSGCAACIPIDQTGRVLDPSSKGFKTACLELQGCQFDAGKCIKQHGSDCSVVPSRNASEICILEGKWRISEPGLESLNKLCDLTGSLHLDDDDMEGSPKEFLRRDLRGHRLGPSDVITYDIEVERCVAVTNHRVIVPVLSDGNASSVSLHTELVLDCTNEIIIPAYTAVCVCNPDDQQVDRCEWAAPHLARFRVQVFIQESFLAALLLLNYIAIAIQHWLRNDGEPLLCCSDCILTFARAAVPLAMLCISFTIRAYYWDISYSGQVETNNDGADDVAEAAIPGVRQLYKPGWPKPDKW